MPVAKELRTNPRWKRRFCWYKYRKEIAICLCLRLWPSSPSQVIAFYRDRREATRRRCLAGQNAGGVREVINRYGDTAAAASAYLCWRIRERNRRSIRSECNAAKVSRKFPQRELASTARMAMAATGGDGPTGRSSRNLPTNCIGSCGKFQCPDGVD